MQDPRKPHIADLYRNLRYSYKMPGKRLFYKKNDHLDIEGYDIGDINDRRSINGYYYFITKNLVSYKSKKQNVVAKSSAEVEYRVMPLTMCQLCWWKYLMQDLRINVFGPMKQYNDNKVVIYIGNNLVFHERTKYIEIDCHFLRDKIKSKVITISTKHLQNNWQPIDLLTKAVKCDTI